MHLLSIQRGHLLANASLTSMRPDGTISREVQGAMARRHAHNHHQAMNCFEHMLSLVPALVKNIVSWMHLDLEQEGLLVLRKSNQVNPLHQVWLLRTRMQQEKWPHFLKLHWAAIAMIYHK